jgi:flagella basal body P-ring formation protein FlgA
MRRRFEWISAWTTLLALAGLLSAGGCGRRPGAGEEPATRTYLRIVVARRALPPGLSLGKGDLDSKPIPVEEYTNDHIMDWGLPDLPNLKLKSSVAPGRALLKSHLENPPPAIRKNQPRIQDLEIF